MIEDFKKDFKDKGTAYITEGLHPLKKSQLNILNKACQNVKKEFVEIGDADEPNHLWVGRFMSDKDRPRSLNKDLAKNVIKILDNEKLKEYVKNVIAHKDQIYIRRIQFNKIEKSCFIGYHLDTDSNPDYLCACVIQLGHEYDGGLYRVYNKDNDDNFFDYKTKLNSLIISDCSYPHEVTRVTGGSRQSLVFFFSNHNKKNRRT